MTRNGEKMAFFTLGDRYGEIECIAFARTYTQTARFISEDAALIVNGTLQFREDEDVKFIVSSIKPLQKNGEYVRSEENKVVQPQKQEEKKHVFGGMQKAKKLYLRVPNLTCEQFVKAKNIVEIFEGETEVIFFDSSNKQYHPSGLGFDATDYTTKQLQTLLGYENVVVK